MDKADEVERLVAEFKKLSQVYHDCREIVRENGEQRRAVAAELLKYVSTVDASFLTGISASQISRIARGKNKRPAKK